MKLCEFGVPIVVAFVVVVDVEAYVLFAFLLLFLFADCLLACSTPSRPHYS